MNYAGIECEAFPLNTSDDIYSVPTCCFKNCFIVQLADASKGCEQDNYSE